MACGPSIYTMNHPWFIVSYQVEDPIGKQRVKLVCSSMGTCQSHGNLNEASRAFMYRRITIAWIRLQMCKLVCVFVIQIQLQRVFSQHVYSRLQLFERKSLSLFTLLSNFCQIKMQNIWSAVTQLVEGIRLGIKGMFV